MSATTNQQATTEDPAQGLRLVVPGRGTRAGAGWDWIAHGWNLFMRAPLMWIVSMVLLLIVTVGMQLIPYIGSVAFQILQPVIAAGFVVACRSIERGGDFDLDNLLEGFRRNFGALLVVGLFLIVGWIVLILVFAGFVGFSMLGAAIAGHMQDMGASLMASSVSILFGLLVVLALMVPLFAAYWFAPALVVMHGMAPVEALKASFGACMRNMVPFLVYGIVMLLFAILAMIPFMLGYLVWIPLMITSTYAAYRQIFTDDEAPAAGVV